ncbi:nuclear transport factor 2 family protein [Actinoplanes campanulatus]|nr:nuclear transport factor 2 family protein [Actinoplanes capillaceus]
MNATGIVEKALRAGREQDGEALAALMAPDGWIEWPFRPPGAPARVAGRERIREFLAGAKDLIRFDEYRNVVIHETTDPGVVIAEYDVEGTVVASGAPFRQTVIAVFRVRDGLIESYRDYIDPLPPLEVLNAT